MRRKNWQINLQLISLFILLDFDDSNAIKKSHEILRHMKRMPQRTMKFCYLFNKSQRIIFHYTHIFFPLAFYDFYLTEMFPLIIFLLFLTWFTSWLESKQCISMIRSDQSLSRVRLFVTPWIAASQVSLSITNSRSSLRVNVHRVGDAIQPSHPLSSPSPPAPNPSQHQWRDQ